MDTTSSNLNDKMEEDEDQLQSLTYQDIYHTLVLNSELIITIPAEEEEKVKIGLKNVKAKKALKDKEEGHPVDNTILSFTSTVSKDFMGAINLHIALLKKAIVPVYKIAIPDKEF